MEMEESMMEISTLISEVEKVQWTGQMVNGLLVPGKKVNNTVRAY